MAPISIPRELRQRGRKMHGVCEKRAIFDWNCRLSRKRCDIGRCLLWNINRKLWVPDQMVSFSMTFSDPQPGFQGHCILTSRIPQKRRILGTKLLKNTNRKPYMSIKWYHFHWPSVTSDSNFNVTTFWIMNIFTIPNIWNSTVFVDFDCPLITSRRFCQHQLGFLFFLRTVAFGCWSHT